MSCKSFARTTMAILILLLLGCAAFMIVVDPYFHFHKPLSNLEYPLNNEFYQNAGIARSFEYEAIIAGDSMTQNAKASLVKELWGYETVKLPNPGAPMVETDKMVKSALSQNKNVKLVIRQFDDLMFYRDPYLERYSKEDKYLWDNNPFNDVKYIFEKETMIDALTVLTYTRAGKKTPSFDEYSNVTEEEDYGNLESFEKYMIRSYPFTYVDDEETICKVAVENIRQNVIDTALKYPETEFCFFLPPYSEAYWHEIMLAEVLDKAVSCERAVLSEIVSVPNIKVFYFMDEFDIATDWSHYSDELHSDEYVLDYMFTEMNKGNKLVTADNYNDYVDRVRDFYLERFGNR